MPGESDTVIAIIATMRSSDAFMRALAVGFTAILIATATIASCAAAERYSVFQSVDRGHSWTRSDVGLPKAARVNAFGFAGGVFLAGTDAGIYYSTDAARTWQRASGASSRRIIAFAGVGKQMFAATDGKGLLASADGQGPWTPESTFPSTKPRSMLAHDGKIYVGTDADGVFSRSEAGQSWDRVATGLPSGAQVLSLAAVKGRLFAGLYALGLYVWDGQRQSWVKTGLVKPLALASVHETLIVGHNPGGLHWSGDLGVTWSKGVAASGAASPLVSFDSGGYGELPPEAPVWELGSDGEDVVLAGAAAGVYSSRDRGKTWERAREGLPENGAGIAFLVRKDFALVGILTKESNSE